MNKDTINKLPAWWRDEAAADLILSNDIDSLWSLRLLEHIHPTWKFQCFYDFETGIYRPEDVKIKNPIGIDLALDYKATKSFDNHVTISNCDDPKNPNSINLNNVSEIHSGNYPRKYCGSTVLMLYSLYNIPLPETVEGKMLLLAVDSTHKSYYNPLKKRRQDWMEIHKHWLCEILGFNELYDLERKHTQEDIEMFTFINRMKISPKLEGDYYVLSGDLPYKDKIEKHIGFNLDLPDSRLVKYRALESRSCDTSNTNKANIAREGQLMSFAMTGKNHANYSIFVA